MSRISIIVGGLFWTSLVALSYTDFAAAQAPPVPGQQNMLPDPEVLDQGPIHEAFAEPLAFGQGEAELVTKQPPAPVQELPPEERPEGRNVEWIPGYFKFDGDRDDFVWVSGLWRDVPPGRTWIPGEWQKVDGGWQWVQGFWSDAEQELSLLPIPPDSLEAGPSSPAPGDNYLWAPGCWQWQNTGYAWQGGYWYQAQPNWVWVPNHYSYTPRGSIFINGYWDYPPQSRGWLYAPVYWGGGYAGYGGNYFYRPRSVINTGLLLANLFVNNRYGGYYYGYNRGNHPGWIQPWGANYGNWGNYGHRGQGKGHHGGYDPLWAYNRWNNRVGDQHGRDFNRGDHRDSDFANGRGRQNGKLVTSVDDFKKDYKQFDGKQRNIRQLSESEVAKVRNQAKKYANFDRSRIGLDAKKDGNVNINRGDGNQGRNRANLGGNSTAQGRILRQSDSNRAGQENLELRNRGQANAEVGNRGRGNIEGRLGTDSQTTVDRNERNSKLRSNTQLENRARVQRDGNKIELGNSTQLRGNVNQRNQGRQTDGSAQTGRQELFYRGSPQQRTNQQQRLQQNVPNIRSQQDSNRQNAIPQGNFRGGSSNSPNIRSNSRVYQGGGQARSSGQIQSGGQIRSGGQIQSGGQIRSGGQIQSGGQIRSGGQGSQRAIQQPRSFSPQSRGSFQGGGNRGGGNQASGGNQGGGGNRGDGGGGGGKGRGK